MPVEQLLIMVINHQSLCYHSWARCKSNTYPSLGISLQHEVQVGWVIVIGPDAKEVIT